MTKDDINYQKVSSDPDRACINCKHFKHDEGSQDIGRCFGVRVSGKATCNNFELKE